MCVTYRYFKLDFRIPVQEQISIEFHSVKEMKPNKEHRRHEEAHDGTANPVIRAAQIGRTAIRNRGKGMVARAAEPVRVVSHHSRHHEDVHSHSEPSSPSGRLFHRISMSLKERHCDPENGVHYCDLVDSSCYNKPCSCEEDVECWRHGNFRMSPPNPSYMSHAASSLAPAEKETPPS